MDRQLSRMIGLFENIPVHTVICDGEHRVLWVSEAALYTCPITIGVGDYLNEILTGQELLFHRCENAFDKGERVTEEISFFDMTFHVEAMPFSEDDATRYIIWHLLLEQEYHPPKVSSRQMLELGAAYRESLFHIYNTVTPLMQLLDRAGYTKEMDYLNIITENCQNMLKTTINVNEFLRINNGSQLYQPEVFSMKKELRDLVDQVNFLLKSVDKYVEFKVDEGNFWVRLDWYKLMLVLLNLIANAVEHTVPGGEIELLLTETDRHVILTMRDYGDGMRDAVKQSAFDPFFSYNMESGMPDGLGLGLYLVKEMTQAQGGTVLLSSTMHVGTTITLQFPREEYPSQGDSVLRNLDRPHWVADRMSPLYAFLSKHCDLHFY